VPGRLIAGTATGLAAAALIGGLFFSPLSGPTDSTIIDTGQPSGLSAAAVQQHAMLAGFEPLADEVGLEAYARLVNNPDVNTQLAH
jgi:hypothetical protein